MEEFPELEEDFKKNQEGLTLEKEEKMLEDLF